MRAIARKNIPGALALAEAVGGTYWLPGPAEDGYGPTLEGLLTGHATRVLRTRVPPEPSAMADAYAAATPSCSRRTGRASATRRSRPPCTAGRSPWAPTRSAEELVELGFRWLPGDDGGPLEAALADPSSVAADLEHNRALAREHFAHDAMRAASAASSPRRMAGA